MDWFLILNWLKEEQNINENEEYMKCFGYVTKEAFLLTIVFVKGWGESNSEE